MIRTLGSVDLEGAAVTLANLLASHPRADVVDPGEDTVVDGLLGSTETTVSSGVLVWVEDRAPADVVFDEAGAVAIDADVIALDAFTVGHRLDLADGRSYVLVSAAAPKHGLRGLHHREYRARRVQAARR